MTIGNTHLAAELPVPEAEKLVLDAVRMGVSMQQFIGYHVLRSAFGVNHPVVVAFEVSQFGKSRT
jgi:hypothetical protein